MLFERRAARRPLLGRGEANQAHDASMRLAMNNGELAEVTVERHEDPAFGRCAPQNLRIARAFGPCSGPIDIVPCVSENFEHGPRNACVQQDLHAVTTN